MTHWWCKTHKVQVPLDNAEVRIEKHEEYNKRTQFKDGKRRWNDFRNCDWTLVIK